MRVLTKKKLREFWLKHPLAEAPLNAWYKVAIRAKWSGPLDIRNTYRRADPIGNEFVFFDICNNDYRLVVRVNYERGTVYVWDVYTHADYDKQDFREIDQQIKKRKKD